MVEAYYKRARGRGGDPVDFPSTSLPEDAIVPPHGPGFVHDRLGSHRHLPRARGLDRVLRLERTKLDERLLPGRTLPSLVGDGAIDHRHRNERGHLHWNAGEGLVRVLELPSNGPRLRHRARFPGLLLRARLLPEGDRHRLRLPRAPLWQWSPDRGSALLSLGSRRGERRSPLRSLLRAPVHDRRQPP